jgi:hypothetical protein
VQTLSGGGDGECRWRLVLELCGEKVYHGEASCELDQDTNEFERCQSVVAGFNFQVVKAFCILENDFQGHGNRMFRLKENQCKFVMKMMTIRGAYR